MAELPPRITEIRRIPPTAGTDRPTQRQMKVVQTHHLPKNTSRRWISSGYRRPTDLSRMAANSTFLVDKVPPGYSSKLLEFENLIDQLIEEEDRKIVLFFGMDNHAQPD